MRDADHDIGSLRDSSQYFACLWGMYDGGISLQTVDWSCVLKCTRRRSMSNTRHVERSLTQKHKQRPPSHKDFVLVSRLGDETYKWARPAQLSRIMMRAVSLNGNCLQYASAGLKDDKEIVLRAVLVWRLEDVPPAFRRIRRKAILMAAGPCGKPSHWGFAKWAAQETHEPTERVVR